MRYKIISFLSVGLMLMPTVAGGAVSDYVWHEIESLPVDDNQINISMPVRLINSYGTDINANINIAAGNQVEIRNSGNLSGDIVVNDNSMLTQVISNADEITKLNVSKSYVVRVQDILPANSLSLNDVLSGAVIGTNANTLELNHSVLHMNVSDFPVFDGNINIVGDVILHIDCNEVFSGTVLTNVSGGALSVDAFSSSHLFAVHPQIVGGSVVLNSERVTNYENSLQNPVGAYLDELRDSGNGNDLLNILDSAQSLDEINRIMARSVQLHPIKLMRSVNLVNQFIAVDTRDSGIHDNISARVRYIFSDDMTMPIMTLSGHIVTKHNIQISTSGYVGMFDVNDDVNKYSGTVLGANLSGRYDDEMIVARMLVGSSFGLFNIKSVFDGVRTVDNPTGTSWYGTADLGVHIYNTDSVDIVPYVGALTDYVSILGDNESNVYGNIGTDFKFKAGDDSLKYFYGARVGILTGGIFYANALVGVDLPDDDLGAEMSVGILRDDIGTSYVISVTGKYVF